MSKNIHICTERLPPNFSSHIKRLALHSGPNKVSLAVVSEYLWVPGSTLCVRFMGGSESLHEKVIKYAQTWTRYANIYFDFGEHEQSDIRISFVNNGQSWSRLGTDARNFPQTEATMNFGWFDEGTSDREISRTVLHEFGHALGCIHEHQHPESEIPWDREAVYAYYRETNEWNRERVDHNIFTRYSRSQTQFSEVDRNSIMHYAIPNQLTIGDWEVGLNTTLSETDKAFIGKLYPFDKPTEWPPKPSQTEWLIPVVLPTILES